MTMPFSPCSNQGTAATVCDDRSVQMLNHIFGDVVNKLALNGDIEGVTQTNSILASMFGVFNSAVLVVGSVIITYIAIVGVLSTANDGEVLGKKWSTMWVPVRLAFSVLMLLPTTTGYSMIQLFVLMIALWGAGSANTTYKAGISTGLFNPEALVRDVNNKKDSYGLASFATSYVSSYYCSKVVNAQYGSSVGLKGPIGLGGSGYDTKTAPAAGTYNTIYNYKFKDRSSDSNTGGGVSLCGSFSLAYNDQAIPGHLSPSAQQLIGIEKIVSNAKSDVIIDTLIPKLNEWLDGSNGAGGFPVKADSDQWQNININQFYAIVNDAEQKISNKVAENAAVNASTTVGADGQVSSAPGNAALRQMIEEITAEGWSMAGGWFQKVGSYRSKLTDIYAAPPGAVESPNLLALGTDDKAQQARTIHSAVLKKLSILKESYLGSDGTKPISAENIESILPITSDPKDIETTGMLNKFYSYFNQLISSMLSALINSLVGSDPIGGGGAVAQAYCGSGAEVGGSLNRMKCVGDLAKNLQATVQMLDITMKIASVTIQSTVAITSATPAQYWGDFTPLRDVLEYVFDRIIAPIIAKVLFWMNLIAFYFGVLLPSLPYITFFTVVIGWVLSVIQTALVSPIWMLMHMQPESSFVGSQRQGYLMLMSMFVRPMLAVIGLFAAILVSDPVINYVTVAFFSMREALVGGGGMAASSAQIWQTFWWIGLYAATLLPILYMIFSLPQSMPDEILRWVGGGIGSLGETSANSGITGSLDSYGRSGAGAGGGGGGGAAVAAAQKAAAANKSGGGGGGGGGKGAQFMPQQGVAPAAGAGDKSSFANYARQSQNHWVKGGMNLYDAARGNAKPFFIKSQSGEAKGTTGGQGANGTTSSTDRTKPTDTSTKGRDEI